MRLEGDEHPVFVVQLPPYVIERWKEAQDTPLAKLTIQGGEVPSVSLKLQGEYAQNLPQDFTATVSTCDMRIFEESDPSPESNTSHIRVSGPVLQMNTNVQIRKLNPETGKMEVDKNVLRLAREKDAEEKQKVKAVATQEISIASGRDRMHPLPSMLMRKRKVQFPFFHASHLTHAMLQNQLYDTEKNKRDKRSRCDRSDLETMLFDLFEKRRQWRIGSLQKRTNQPISWLKEVLNDIAEMHHSGPLNGLYELKPEFNKNPTDTS